MKTILIIDDEPAIVNALKKTISAKLGYDVLTASDSQAGCEIAKNPDVKLIISDLMMPGQVSGMDLINQLRAMRPDCPVIVLSGYPTNDRLKKTSDMGIEFLTKPFEIPFLTAAIERLLEADSGSGSPPGASK